MTKRTGTVALSMSQQNAAAIASVASKIDTLTQIVSGNGTPEKGLVVTVVRIEEKLDGILASMKAHHDDKSIHRTEFDAQKKMGKVALWLIPVATTAVVFIHITLAGEWVKVGQLIEKWLGLPSG